MMSENRIVFPSGFKYGTATASYQIEGAHNEDGKGVSIWDTFSHTEGKVHNGENGDIACDHYHRWQNDVKIMQSLNLNAYRFSISWPRILPEGTGAVNSKGLNFYDKLVDELMEVGIDPFVTLYHWDLPQVLEDKGGWTNRDTAYAFAEYAGVVADRLGDRVKNWITLNEPWVSAVVGYVEGRHAPGESSFKKGVSAAHHLLLGHGLAVPILRERSQSKPEVGITLSTSFGSPASDSPEDIEAANRNNIFSNDWFLSPLFKAEYPASWLPTLESANLPVQPGDLKIIAAPLDFLGVNFYIRVICKPGTENRLINVSTVKNPSAQYTEMDWEVYPQGIHDILTYIQKNYNPPKVYITENGAAFPDVLDETTGRVHDVDRVNYLKGYIAEALKAIDEGVNLQGYFVWSFLDNFEWAYGFSKRFGIVYVDYPTQRRFIKDSGLWYAQAIKDGGYIL
jgi:beta-glucosidase